MVRSCWLLLLLAVVARGATQVTELGPNKLGEAQPGFDWGGSCGGPGEGSFEQPVERGAQLEVGLIPAGKKSIRISLTSVNDVDLRLYEASGAELNLVGWPKGEISGPGLQSMMYRGSRITWSGYNGVDGEQGNEYVHIEEAPLAADLVLFVYGYRAGQAQVKYSYDTQACDDSFSVYVGHRDVHVLGTIPAGLTDVRITLSAATDVDIQLQETGGDRTLLVGWPDGVLNKHLEEKILVPITGDMSQLVSYSGYNGQGGNKGNEWIELHGTTVTSYEMRVYGYAAGSCTVAYTWEKAPAPPPPPPSPGHDGTPGTIVKVDMMVEMNRQDKARHVFLYRDPQPELKKLIIRRGSYAQFKLWLTVPLDHDQHELRASLEAVRHSHTQPFTTLSSCDGSDPGEWTVCISGQSMDGEHHLYTLRMNIPPTAPFSEWVLHLELLHNGVHASGWVGSTQNVFTIFNPYNPTDADVFLSSAEERREYIENENGAIWVGGEFSNSPRNWVYNQFNIKAMIAAYHLLTRHTQNGYLMPIEYLADPVRVSRALSYKVAAHMIVGRWSEPYCSYEPCENTKPWVWTGSLPIIEKYLTDLKPVKWGQCWVFAGTQCTLARAIGIPARTVTNFQSAHDVKPYDSFVTKHWTYSPVYSSGSITGYVWKHDSQYDRDSIWNFHVWNEMWMKRPDLQGSACGSVSLDGWQAVDATWQEQSDLTNLISPSDPGRYYQCGPIPVVAIKNKCTAVKYDYPFVYGEVESVVEEVVRNLKEYPTLSLSHPRSSDWKRDVWGYSVDSTEVGKLMSTSAIGGDIYRRNVVTAKYKTPDKERQLGEVAEPTRVLELPIMTDEWGSVSLEIPTTVEAGVDWKIVLTTKKFDAAAGSVDVAWSLCILHYNGKFSHHIKEEEQTLQIGDTGIGRLEASVLSLEYAHLLKHGVTMGFTASIQENDKLITRITDVRTAIKLPHIDVQLIQGARIKRCLPDDDEVIDFSLTVHNPFKKLGVNESMLLAEIGGMDSNPKTASARFEWPVPKLEAGQDFRLVESASSVVALGCGKHTIAAAWDISEFAETQDAVGSAEFLIDCSACGTNADPHDESVDARVKLSEMPVVPISESMQPVHARKGVKGAKP